MSLRPTVLKGGVIVLADPSDDLAITSIVTLTGAQVISGKTLGADLAAAGFSVTGLRLPTANTDASTKQYTDASAAGLQPHGNARVQAQVNVVIATPGANIDGIAMAPGDVVALFQYQITGTETGLWTWNGAAVPLTRCPDMLAGSPAKGAYFYVVEGTDAGLSFICTNTALLDIVGVDTLLVSEFTIAPVDGPAATPSLRTLGTGALQAAAGNAAPTAHQSSHVSGSDQIPDATTLTRGLMTTAQVTALAASSGSGYMGNVCRVDQALGNDATGARSGPPFKTITAALAVALSGDALFVMPGNYNESITIPAGVSVVGLAQNAVTIQRLLVTSDTDLVTMGEGSSMQQILLLLTSAQHHTLRGMVWPGTTALTASGRAITVTVDNHTASALGTSNVYAIHATGTGADGDTISTLRAFTITVASAGLGAKRGILVSGATAFNARDIGVTVTNSGGAGTYIGAETTNATAIFRARLASFSGATADISQTTVGSLIDIGSTNIVNANANGLGFGVSLGPSNSPIVFADDGGIATGTRYMRVGTAAASTTETYVRMPGKGVVRSISVRAVTPPGAGHTDTWTVRINGVDTGVVASLTNAATSSVNVAVSAGVSAPFDISVKQVSVSGSNTANVSVIVGVY